MDRLKRWAGTIALAMVLIAEAWLAIHFLW